MHKTFTIIQTEHASKYLMTLCRHFARKVESEWSELQGAVKFPKGDCEMHVDTTKNQLVIFCSAENEVDLALIKSILESHVELFSRRETVTLSWQ
jgi:hypothetical protein